jgi:hypothetical protein
MLSTTAKNSKRRANGRWLSFSLGLMDHILWLTHMQLLQITHLDYQTIWIPTWLITLLNLKLFYQMMLPSSPVTNSHNPSLYWCWTALKNILYEK